MSRREKERRALARAAAAADADGSREPGRFSAQRKTETTLPQLPAGRRRLGGAPWAATSCASTTTRLSRSSASSRAT
jgi:hypothetical protein